MTEERLNSSDFIRDYKNKVDLDFEYIKKYILPVFIKISPMN